MRRDPGEILREDFLPDHGLSVAGLAAAIGASRQSINELLRGRRAVSAEMVLRLSRLFGNTAEFWMNAQRAVDLWDALQVVKEDVARIQPLRVAVMSGVSGSDLARRTLHTDVRRARPDPAAPREVRTTPIPIPCL